MSWREFDGFACLFVGTAMMLTAATSSAELYSPDVDGQIRVADVYLHNPRGSLSKTKHNLSKSKGSPSNLRPDQRLANPKFVRQQLCRSEQSGC